MLTDDHKDVKFEPSAAYLFKYLLLANMIQYMEAGAVPALLLALSHSFEMQPGQQGLLGAVVYLSLSLGGPLAGLLIRKYDHKRILVCSIGTNLFLTFLWAMTPIDREFSTTMFISVRFIMGFTQCIVCVFLPLWTMENAPKTMRTTWMSYLQASVPFGVMCGYIVASVTITTCSPSAVSDPLSSHMPETCFGLIYWRWPFLVEIILLLPLFILLQFVPERHISVHTGQRPKRSSSYKFNTESFRDRESQNPGERDSSSNGSKDDRPPSLQLRDEQVGGFTRYISTANSSTVKMAAGQRYMKAVVDDDSDDYRKYDDEYIKLKAQLLAEEKRQWVQLQRNSMSASMYDSMASINVAVRGSDDFSFVDTEDYLPNSKRVTAAGAYRSNQYGSVGAELSNINIDDKANGIKPETEPVIQDSAKVRLLGSSHHSMSNISDSSESSSKAAKWVFSFFPLNFNAVWKTSLSYSKLESHRDHAISSELSFNDRLDVEMPHSSNAPQQLHKDSTNRTQYSSPLREAAIGESVSKSEVGVGETIRKPINRFFIDKESHFSGLSGGISTDKSPSNSLSSVPSRVAKKKSVSRKKATYSLQYESLRELPAVPKSIGLGIGIGVGSSNEVLTRQRSSTMPLSSDNLAMNSLSNGSILGTSFLHSDSRSGTQKSHGLQILSPLFDWRRGSRFGSVNTGSTFDDMSMDDAEHRKNFWRNRKQGSFISHTRSKSLTAVSSSFSFDLEKSPHLTSVMSTDYRPSPHERSRKNEFRNRDYVRAKAAKADDFVYSHSTETEKEKLLKHLMMSKSSSDSDLFRHLDTKDVYDDPAQPVDDSPSLEDTALKGSAFSRYIGTPKRNTVEYYSNSESEEEWLGLDNDASYSTASPFYGGRSKARGPPQSGMDSSDIERQSLLPSAAESTPSLPQVFVQQFNIDVSKGCNCLRKTFLTVNSLLAISEYRNLLGAVTALYFTVTGVQYWGTKYLSIALNAPMPLVNSLFIICAATGPTSGVFFGGWLIDLFGGFKGPRQRIVALELCAVLGVLACLFALPITFIDNIFVAVTCLWMVLFFGGSTLPACSGIIVSIVPRRHRATSSSLSLVVFNLFGYFLSLILSGYLMQLLEQEDAERGNCSPVCAMTWGFRLVLFWSFFSLYFLLNALRASYVRSRNVGP